MSVGNLEDARRTEAAPVEDPAELYLELLKECLLGHVYGPEVLHVPVQPRNRLLAWSTRLMGRLGFDFTRPRHVPGEAYDVGPYMGPPFPERIATLIPRTRLDNVQACVETVLREDVPGDLIETGVWRGGTVVLMRAILKARGATDRLVWGADSFAGLPPPDSDTYPLDDAFREHDPLAVGVREVRATFHRYGVLDDGIRLLEGWFRDTLPTVANRQWSVIRLDADMYESTMDALKNLYPGLSAGGYVIIDDYGDYRACRQAVDDYRAEHGITDPIHQIDWSGVYWRRETSAGRLAP